jgi:hypothetical protein
MSLIQRDHAGLVQTDLYWDEHTEEMHVARVQDVEPVLERNKAIRAAGWDGYNGDRSMRAVAEIPVTIVEQWQREGVEWWNQDHNAELQKRIADPALSGFRIATPAANAGRIIVKGVK